MIVFSFPEFIILSLLVLTLLAYLFRAWGTWTAVVAGASTGLLALWIWWTFPAATFFELPLLPLGINLGARLSQFDFLFYLSSANLPVIVLSLALTSIALVMAGLADQGVYFVPIILLIVTGYVGIALLQNAPVEPILLIPLLLALLSALGVFVLQGDQLGRTLGPLRSMLSPVLAFPFFLPVAWYIEQIPLNPQNNETFMVAGWLLALGLLFLLAPAPLHSGRPITAQSAPPIALALLTLLYQLAVLALLYRVMMRFSFVVDLAPLTLWLTVGGVFTAIWGGVAAAGTSHPGRLWGYALLHDWGLILLILAIPGADRWPLVISLFVLRSVSTLTAAVGLSHLREVAGAYYTPLQLQGVGTRLPWSSAAFLLGVLGLAGFPLSAGFPGHWAALQVVAQNDWRVAAAVLIASGGVVFGCVRLVRLLFGPIVDQFLPRERIAGAVVALLVILFSAGVALAPQMLEGSITWALFAFGG
jgi:formate hydrogenlyase subunit 3/multisubunit Na+/H+ antiporter MnhD subunit